ncbi:2-amino-4-hydroxy-6-hydroxymethyldihydropteridine diphosphokinase [bacterium]|nr:2-amino-4-hydroxy-6-hydroxymethyldihydropteridine diphosphokinase [bacterium]
MAQLILLLGGNEGDVMQTLEKAKALLKTKLGVIVNASALYESEPWGFEHALPFVNQVVEIDAKLEPQQILRVTQQIEQELGRREKTKAEYEGRSIDIDLLFYDQIILEYSNLILPHPRIQERMFTLMPLADKWSDYYHPVLQKTVDELMNLCNDTGWVRKL